MAFIDLGNPLGMVVSGPGSEVVAERIGGFDSGSTVDAYSGWIHDVPPTMVASECGARILPTVAELPSDIEDDFGSLIASRPGSNCI